VVSSFGLLVAGYWLLINCDCLSPVPIGDARPMFDRAGHSLNI